MRYAIIPMLSALLVFSACGGPAPQQQAAQPPGEVAKPAPPPPAPYYVYVTNETGDNLTVINGGTDQVEVTIPLGKRPRGVKVSPDGKQLFVALSGSPIGGPGVDESKLPPADKKADGVAVVEFADAAPASPPAAGGRSATAKSDVSDFAHLRVPKSAKADFGVRPGGGDSGATIVAQQLRLRVCCTAVTPPRIA